MCMVCNTATSLKKKVAIFVLLAAGMGVAVYFASIIHNPALLTVAPILVALAPCLIMCGAIGGSMWLVPRFRNKNAKPCGCGAYHGSVKANTEESLQVSKDRSSDVKTLQSNQEK